MRNKTEPTNIPDPILTKLVDLAERSKQLTKDAEQLHEAVALEREVRLARGTKRDMQPLEPSVAIPLPRPRVEESPLYLQLKEMCTRRPYTLQELITESGAETNKVKVCLLRMQRDDVGLENMGTRYRALWFIPSAAFRARMKQERDTDVG